MWMLGSSPRWNREHPGGGSQAPPSFGGDPEVQLGELVLSSCLLAHRRMFPSLCSVDVVLSCDSIVRARQSPCSVPCVAVKS